MQTTKIITALMFLALIQFAAIATADIDEGLIAHYNFDNGTAIDVSGGGHDGVLIGNPAFIPAECDDAISPDGIDDYVNITGNIEDLMFNNQSLSISTWVQITDNVNEKRLYVYLGRDQSYSPNAEILLVKDRSGHMDGRIHMVVAHHGALQTTASSILTGEQLPKNEWLHLAGIVDKESDCVRLYINGELQEETYGIINFDLSTGSKPFRATIGTYELNNYQNGPMDEVRIYNRALSASEVQTLYEQCAPGDDPYYYVAETSPGSDIWRIFENGCPNPYIIQGVVKNSLEWNALGHWAPDGGHEYSSLDFENIKNDWNANTVRIPLNQVFWLNRPEYRDLIDNVVSDANSIGLNIILDLHWTAGGTLSENLIGQYRMPDNHSLEFWFDLATRYKDRDSVFFEVFNEPYDIDIETWLWGSSGDIGPGDYIDKNRDMVNDSGLWHAVGMQEIIDIIRVNAEAKNLIIVPGRNWAKDLSHIDEYALNGINIAYSAHAYQEYAWINFPIFKVLRILKWNYLFGDVSSKYPVVLTEYGQYDCCSNTIIDLLNYIIPKDIGFTAWAWYWQDPSCSMDNSFNPCEHPTIISDWNGTPSAIGMPTYEIMKYGYMDNNYLCDCKDYTDTEYGTEHCNFCPIIIAKLSPIDMTIIDSYGNMMNNEVNQISGGYYSEYEIADGDTAAIAFIQQPFDEIYQVIITPKSDALPNETFTLFAIQNEDTLFALCDAPISSIDTDGYFISTLDTGSISGIVEAEANALTGVPVDLYDSLNNIIASALTDSAGYYQFPALNNGDYSVSISTPLGYQTSEETKSIKVSGLPHEINFELNQLDMTPSQRSRGYWAHQLHRALKDRPKHYTTDDFAGFAGLIDVHFNQNELNPVNFYTVTQPANQNDSLTVLKRLLHMRNTDDEWEPMLKRLAKAQLMALMLNVVSGKVHQTYEITQDGRTISQLITYCDMLVNDEIDPSDNDSWPGYGSPWFRYIYAGYMLVRANLGLTIPSGMIPANVINITYKHSNEMQLPEGFELSPNYPNPFNPETEISYSIPSGCHVTLEVYNITGQKVVTLIDGYQEAGRHTARWDSRDEQGDGVASGIYLYRLTAGEYTQTRKMTLMK